MSSFAKRWRAPAWLQGRALMGGGREPASLRAQVLHGGAYLVLRQGASVCLRLVGVLILTRLIGPSDYGLYSAALGVSTFWSELARMGTDFYLIRRQEESPDRVYDQVFSFLLVSSCGLAALGVATLPLFGYWMGDSRFLPPLSALLVTLPLVVLRVPALSRLERALDYRAVAGLELSELVVFYAIAVVLAFMSLGVWALVISFVISQVWVLGNGCRLSRYRPRWHWSADLFRELSQYALSFSISGWIWQLRPVIKAVVVGRFLGPEGIGYLTLAESMVDGLSFVKAAAWRLSIAALAKIQDSLPSLRRALEEAMALQVLAVGPFLAGFAVVSPWVVPLLFGERWRLTLVIYPFVAFGVLVNTVFNMHSSVLYVLKRNQDVGAKNAAHVVLLAAAAAWLVPVLGLVGWGVAEIVAMLGYVVIHLYVRRLFAIDYRRALLWLVAFSPPLFASAAPGLLGLALWIPAVVVPFTPPARRQLGEYWAQLRGS